MPRSLGLILVMGSLLLAGCIKTHDEEAATPDSAQDPSAVPADEPTDLEHGEATLAATLGCPNYDERSRHCLLLKIDYRLDTQSSVAARPPLNIALVLDRSSS